MTTGTVLLICGISGCVISTLLIIVCLITFPRKRRKLLQKIAER